jgi:hypothetical protein
MQTIKGLWMAKNDDNFDTFDELLRATQMLLKTGKRYQNNPLGVIKTTP